MNETLTVPQILAAMAARIAQVPGVNAAYYPGANLIEGHQCPAVVLYWGSDVDTVIDHSGAGQEVWLPAVRAQVLVPRLGDTPAEFGAIDDLLHPIADAFRGRVSDVLPGLDGHVDRVLVERLRPTLQVNYAGHEYYCAEIYFSMKFRRER